MEYRCDKSLTSFEFWSGAADRAKLLTYAELDSLDGILPEYFGEELPTDTDINDMFWFDFPMVCHALGYACVDDNPIREAEDFKQDFRIEALVEELSSSASDPDAVRELTDTQLKKLDKKCLDEGDVYTVNVDDDTCGVDGYYAEAYAKELGFLPEDAE